MKSRLLISGLLVAGMAFNANAQVQADRQLQMTGTSNNDRRITGVGTAADSADAVNAATLLNNRLAFAPSTASGGAYAVQLRVAPESYSAGMILSFKAAGANTGAITLNVNGLGAKPVFKNVSEALEAGDIQPNQVVSVIYDGVAFQVISQLRMASGFRGALSGDVVGTQENTLISNSAVTTAKVADGAITNEKVAAGISYHKLVDVPTALPPTGAAGGDLSGSFPEPVIAPGAVNESKIADGSVSTLKIQDGAIISLKLADGSVLTAKIADAAITTAKIEDGAVTADKLASGAVTNDKITSVDYSKVTGAPAALPPSGIAGGDLENEYPNPVVRAGAITENKIAPGAVTGSRIAAGAVGTAAVADGAITDEKIASVAYAKVTGAPVSLPPNGVAGGDLSGSYPEPVIRDAAVTDTKIAGGAVTGEKLADGSVSTSKLAAGAVNTAAVADGAITNEKISSVDYSKVSGAPVALAPTGAATGDLSGSYPAPVIRDAAVSSNKIAAGAVTADKINTAGAASGQVLSYDGTGVVWTTPATVLTGAASGDLNGNYPAPVIANGVVTAEKIAAGAVTNDKVAYGLSYNKLVDVPTALPPTGVAGGDLAGSYPAPVIAPGAVTGTKVASGAINNSHVAAGAAIDYSKLNLSNSITASDLADGSVATGKIVDGAVTDAKISSVDYSKITNTPAGLPPVGTAGGDLEGSTYPAPLVKAGAITTSKLADGAVSASKIAAASVGTTAVQDAAITDEKIASVAFTKITGVPAFMKPLDPAGGDLAGTYPDPVIRNEAITDTKIAPGAVTVDKINTAGAEAGHVLTYNGSGAAWTTPNTHPTGDAGGDLTGSYPNPAIADNAVTAGKIAAGAITNNHIAPTASISYSKLNLANSIVSTDLANNSVTTFKLANGAVTTSKISTTGASNGQVLTYNGSTVTWGTVSSVPGGAAGGDLSGSYPNPVVRNGVITSSKIADGSITDDDIDAAAGIAYSKLNLANSITAADITASAVTGDKVADGAITTAKVADGAITDSKLASGISYSKLVGAPTSMKPSGAAGGDLTGSYPSPSIATNAVTAVKIADGAVESNKLGEGAVVTGKLADGAVTPAKISTAGATSGQVLSFNGSEVVWTAPAGSGATALQFHGSIGSPVAYATGSPVLFPNAATNVGGQMNTSTGTFTAAAEGLYQFNASLPSEADGARFLALRVNGVDVFTGSGATSFFAGSPYNATVSALSLSVAFPLQAADQVEIVVYTNSGTATPLTNGSARLLITKL